MKSLIGTILMAAVVTANAVTFDLGSKARPASASVEKQGERLLVSCRFTPPKALKNNPGLRAKYNDRRARSLCEKALKLYFKIQADEIMNVSGLSVAQPSRGDDSAVEYFFSVPESGISSYPDPNYRVRVASAPVPAPAAAPAPAVAAAPETAPAVAAAPAPDRVRTRTSFRVIKYKVDQGKVSITSSREYSVSDFPDRAAFDDFCARQFQTIARNSEKAFADINRRFEDHLRRLDKLVRE